MDSEVLQISVNESGSTRVLRLTGELDAYTCEQLASMADVWMWGISRIVINLDDLQYIDSAGLSVLVGMWVKAIEGDVKLDIVCCSPRIQRVLEITGLLNLFAMDCTVPEARAMLAERYRQSVVGGGAQERVGALGGALDARRTGVRR